MARSLDRQFCIEQSERKRTFSIRPNITVLYRFYQKFPHRCPVAFGHEGSVAPRCENGRLQGRHVPRDVGHGPHGPWRQQHLAQLRQLHGCSSQSRALSILQVLDQSQIIWLLHFYHVQYVHDSQDLHIITCCDTSASSFRSFSTRKTLKAPWALVSL